MPRRSVPVLALAPWLALALLGCSRSGPVGQQPSWRRPPQVATSGLAAGQPLHFEPRTPASESYNDPPITPAPSSPLADAIVDAVNQASLALGKEPPRPDGRLYAAVLELARVAPPSAPLPNSLLEFTIQRQGIIEPAPHLLVSWGPIDDPEEVADRFRSGLAARLGSADYARIGIASVYRPEERDSVTVLAFQSSFVETSPVPRSAPVSGSFRIEGKVSSPYQEPQLFVTRIRGGVERPPLIQLGARGFRGDIPCGGEQGRLQIEIIAQGSAGATVLANFPVWCGQEPPATLTVAPSEDEPHQVASSDSAERLLVDLVNRDRARHRLAPLEVDARVAGAARAYSREMSETGQVGHVSPISGSASDRLRASGVHGSVVLENVARAYGVHEAEEGLMNSPGHRANILSDRVTHMGMGVVIGEEHSGRREYYITQLFVRLPGRLEPEKARAQIEGLMRRTRTLVPDSDLEEVAQGFADMVARGVPTDQASAQSSGRLRSMSTRYSRVTTLVTAVAELSGFDPSSTLGDKRITHYGLGLAQGDHPEMGEGAIYVVLLLGHQ
jgi:uncharacterized protein YkwD